jgi:hypothetical protein
MARIDRRFVGTEVAGLADRPRKQYFEGAAAGWAAAAPCSRGLRLGGPRRRRDGEHDRDPKCAGDMPKQPRLVLATAELSRHPDPAIVSGARMSALTRSALHVLHCVPAGTSIDVIRATGESLQRQTPSGTTVTVVSGTPHEEIAAEAARSAADIVVLGPRPDPAAAGRLGRTAQSGPARDSGSMSPRERRASGRRRPDPAGHGLV